ncbi:MAG: hypothetical protein WAN93_10685 [Solirubrobacteraceae bacterium]
MIELHQRPLHTAEHAANPTDLSKQRQNMIVLASQQLGTRCGYCILRKSMLLSDIADSFLTRTLADTTHERPEGRRSDHMDCKELCKGRAIRSSQGPMPWEVSQHPKDGILALVECLLDLTR